MRADHVFTVSMRTGQEFSVHEFYRGSKRECCRLQQNFGGVVYSDRQPIHVVQTAVGTLAEWQEFLRQ